MGLDEFRFEVKSSWVPDTKQQLSNVVSVGEKSDPSQWSEEFAGEIQHEITQGNLLRLSKPPEDQNGDTPCSITIRVDDPRWRISKVSVVSQARIVEIYGPMGEYICTAKGNNISDVEECLYNAQPDINLRNELFLKFPAATSPIWVYGVKLLVDRTDSLPPGTVDYLHVDEMLKSSRLPLTDKAEQARLFLQKFSAASDQKQPDPRAILRILESEYKSRMKPVEDAGRNVSQYIASLMQAKPAKKEEGASGAGLVEVKAYVDSSMKELEERVQNNLKIQLEAIEEKQNKKLDAILQLLSQRN